VADHAADAEREVLETSRGMRTRLRESRSGSVPPLSPIPMMGGGNEIHSGVHTGVLRRPGSVSVRSGRGPPTSHAGRSSRLLSERLVGPSGTDARVVGPNPNALHGQPRPSR
jgi:hypothetical protein